MGHAVIASCQLPAGEGTARIFRYQLFAEHSVILTATIVLA